MNLLISEYSDHNHQGLTPRDVQTLCTQGASVRHCCSAGFADEESEVTVSCPNPCGGKTPNPSKLQRPEDII